MSASAASAPASEQYRPARVNPAFAQSVIDGLTQKGQKTLPPSWFYDEVGSALFEAITVLPEYGLTRAEAGLLSNAAHEILRTSNRPSLVIELGSGTGMKTRHILAAAAHYHTVHYLPIDISAAALDSCAKTLGAMERVSVKPIEATYLDGIDAALAGSKERRQTGEPALLLFLGSTIGNFNRTQATSFLARIRKRMHPGDYLLLGADLVKPRAKLLSAYNDPIGVTAAFNLNLLARINRELDGHFELSQFAHEARFNERRSRIEMHLRSRIAQEVSIGALGLTIPFAAGETIWTESSHKFRPEDVSRIGQRAGWSCTRQWVECDWGFSETLFRKAHRPPLGRPL
jgi:L-histidine N-alpha-methyltransferase